MKHLFFAPKGSGKNHQLPQILAILSATISCVTEGLLFSWTSPAIPALITRNSTNITLEEASYFTVIAPIGMALTAPIFPYIMSAIGPRKSIILVAIPQLVCWALSGLAKSIWVFYFARFMAGVVDAAIFATVPVYICEIAEPRVRGTWGNATAVGIYLGIFLINVIGAFNSMQATALICGSLPLIHMVLVYFMPESPYYLLTKNREEEAKEALQVLRWRTDVEKELLSLKADVQRQVSESGTIKDLFTIASNRKALLLCMGIRAAQQFSGLPAFELYTQYMFQKAGGNLSEKTSAIILSGFLAGCVTLAAPIVEKFGRKPLMIFSSFGCALALAVETVYFSLAEFTELDLSEFGWVPLAGMMAYILICSCGLGIIPTLVLGELFSASIKGKAGCVMNISLACYIIIVPKLFQSFTHNFGIFSPFCFFTICAILGGIFSLSIIETKEKTLEEIQQDLKGNKKSRMINTEL